jgi:hypothetical protein
MGGGSEPKGVIVTGPSQDTGAGAVQGFRDRDYRVVDTSRSVEQSSDPDVLAVVGDIGDPETA